MSIWASGYVITEACSEVRSCPIHRCWLCGTLCLPCVLGSELQARNWLTISPVPKAILWFFKKVTLIAGQAWSRWKDEKVFYRKHLEATPFSEPRLGKKSKAIMGCKWRNDMSRSLSSDQYLYSYTLASELQWMHLTKRIMQTKIRGYTNPRKLCSNLHIFSPARRPSELWHSPCTHQDRPTRAQNPRPAFAWRFSMRDLNMFKHGVPFIKQNRHCIGNATSNASDRL